MSLQFPKTLGFVAAILVVILVAAAYVIFRLNDVSEFCKTTIRRNLPSPDKTVTLVIFERDCGATTDFNTQMGLMPQGGEYSVDEYPPFFAVHGWHGLNARWLGNHKIEIVTPSGEQIYRQKAYENGISVEYRRAKP